MLYSLTLLLAQDPEAVRAYTYPQLLAELYDLRYLTAPPLPGERAFQFSSYDRASQAGAGNAEAWFANRDAGHFLRVEERRLPDGSVRQEYVLAETDGPGVITRIWSANPEGRLLFYVDGAGEPALEVSFQDLCRGDRAPFLAPLCGVRARGWNCYLPLPFQKHVKVSATAGGFYYQVNVRTWPAGVVVPTLSRELLDAHAAPIQETCRILQDQAPPYRPDKSGNMTGRVAPGKSLTHTLRGEGTAREFWVQLTPLHLAKDLPAALRSVRFQVHSGAAAQPLVDCPLGDFFGAAPGWNPYRTWAMGVYDDGRMYCRLPIPFRNDLRLMLINEGAEPINARIEVWFDFAVSGPLTLHAAWKQERALPTRPMRDYQLLALDAVGPGRFVGSSLSVRNPVRTWWGEGDEKFYVDGEAFPSTFGTGTEDYFGYAWCCPEPFEGPFHAQARCDGPGNYGYTSVNRFQLADHVPFQRSFRFDLEVWHWDEQAQMDYASMAYWYAAADTGHSLPPLPPAAERVARPVPPYPYFRVPNALEAEDLRVAAITRGKTSVQDMSGFGQQWSGEKQLWWTGGQPDETLILALPVPADGRYRLQAQFTKADDYAVVEVLLDGKKIGAPIDLYAPAVTAAPLALGEFELRAGERRLAFRISGKNEQAKPAYMLGLDYLLLEPLTAPAEGGVQAPGAGAANHSLYALHAPDLDGREQSLAQYAGQVALVVNVASACGYTPQYAGLQELQRELGPQGFVVLGFPSNEFGGQEPGGPGEIRRFCSERYQVTFPLFGKVETKSGAGQSPVYAYLSGSGNAPDWNFCKYLVGRDGRVRGFFPSKVAPESAELRQAVALALAERP